jgi:VWFA-related protein
MITTFAFSQSKPQFQTKKENAINKEVTILVTAYPHNEKQRETVAKLQNNDFAVLENKRSQRIISVKNASDSPMNLAVVVQDNLGLTLNSEINYLKDFIRNLPENSKVMTAYLTNGGAIVTQELTQNKTQAADSLRNLRSVSFPTAFSPYDGVQTVLKHFDDTPVGRKMVLVISDGLDTSLGLNYASPYFSVSLNKAIKEAERRGIAVFTIYSPSEDRKVYGRFAINYGQGSLIRLADETGGESYIGLNYGNFTPYLEEFKQIFPRQWLITYRSSSTGNNFRKIEVTTDFDIHLHHPAGYQPQK